MAFSDFSLDGGLTINSNALLEQTALACANWFNRQDQLQAIANACGTFTTRYYLYDPDMLPPCRMLVQQGNNLYVHIGGTNQVVVGNVLNVLGAAGDSPVGSGVYNNSFFLYCMNQCEPAILAAMPAGWQTMNLRFVGHSQGSAVALMLGAKWAQQYGTINYDWFGLACPRAFAGATLPTNLQPRWGFVVVNDGDAVPRLPPNTLIWSIQATSLGLIGWGTHSNWRHYGRIATLTQTGAISYTTAGINEPALTPQALAALADKHPMQRYTPAVLAFWRQQNG